MKILVIGRPEGLIETAKALAEGLKLPLVEFYKPRSKSVEDLLPGVYVCDTMQYQQAKTLSFETVVVNRPATVFNSKQTPGTDKIYEVVNAKTNEPFIRNGVPTNCLSLSGARQVANKINIEASSALAPIATIKIMTKNK